MPRPVTKATCPCGVRFEAHSSRAVYCSPRCRQRASRARQRPPEVGPLPPGVALGRLPSADDLASLTDRVLAELVATGSLDSAAGSLAVKLAQLIDSASIDIGGGQVAGWSRELRSALAEAKQQAPAVESDPVDELLERRGRKRAAGA